MNKFDNLTSDIMAESKEEDSSSDYLPDSEMLKKGYDWDSSGLYIPYTFKYEKNPDSRDIYLKIERLPDKKTDFIIYSWNYKVNGEYKRLNFFRRSILPVEEEIESNGKSSINKKLSHTGRLARLNSDKGVYKEFMEDLLMDIINSPCLDIFKDLDYDFPIPDDEEIEEIEDSELDDIIQSRINPELTDDDLADAREVKELIDEFGLIKFLDSIVNKFHVGNHRAIYRKHLGGVNIIRGKGSYFIYTKAKSNVGKSLEDSIAFLMMIPERYIFKKNQMTLASFSRYGDQTINYFERMIIYFGDLGNKKAYEKVEDVFDAIKTLITEKEFSRDLTEGSSSNLENNTLELKAKSIGAVFQTVRYNFLGDEEEQIASRSIQSTPLESNDDEVLDFLFALNLEDSLENKAQEMAMEEVRKYHNYLLWIIKQDIKIVNPYRRFFKRFVKDSNVIFRDFEQIIELFDAFCVLTHGDCIEYDGRLIASQEQLQTFITELSVENVLPPEESNFIKMLISEDNKTELKIIDESDEDSNPIQDYEINVLNALDFNQNLDKYEYTSIDELEPSKKQRAISKLTEMYKLGGKGFNHEENVFFTIPIIKRTYNSRRAFKDIDEVGNLLDKLYSNLYLNKLPYLDSRGNNLYYLTSKCKEILNPIKIEEEDIKDANDFMSKQGIKYAISYQKKAES